ncbi:MAG: tol-pal system protein YbgF [Bacteroidota bacterium]
MRNAKLTFVFAVLGCTLLTSTELRAQARDYGENGDSIRLLMMDAGLQMDIAQAINDMYNFNMEAARQKFVWLRSYAPNHPLYPFLMGLSYWWLIVPNTQDKTYDKIFLQYMNLTIDRAEELEDIDPNHPEANFFLAAAWGFKGRLYSERKNYAMATIAGKNAVNYLDEGRKYKDYGPEFLFGDGLYNYYSVYVSETIPALKPVINMFPDGDKQLGVDQLLEVSRFAFYTRTEAQYFLLSILGFEQKRPREAMQIASYLHETYPNNPYFHRFYALLLHRHGRYEQAKQACMGILNRIDSGYVGYEATSGRYASYLLGTMFETGKEYEEAKFYYRRAVAFGEEIEATESGYYLYSLLNLAKIADKEGNTQEATRLYRKIKRYAKRKHPAHERARKLLRERRRG